MNSLMSLNFPVMRESRVHRSNSKLLFLSENSFSHHTMEDLPDLLPPNSVLVINNASTIPASFKVVTSKDVEIEIRLASLLGSDPKMIRTWNAVTFGEGDWRTDTELRGQPASLFIGETLSIGKMKAKIIDISPISPRWITLEFLGDMQSIWDLFFKAGKPIQYSHLSKELKLYDVQTIFSSIPVSAEPASASFQFTWSIIEKIKNAGIEIIPITHATTLSHTGDIDLDELLPFPENYWITTEAAMRLNKAIRNNKRIVGVGTSVTRALEAEFQLNGKITSGFGRTNLVIDENFKRQIVTDLFTGMHLPTESHIRMLSNFASSDQLEKAYEDAITNGYFWHEYGDVSLIYGK